MMKLICDNIEIFCPDVVIIEDTFFFTNAKVLKDLSRLQGAIIYYCYMHDIELKIYLPTQWRKILELQVKGAKRKELKEIAQNYVYNNYHIQVSEDITDAICIGSAYNKESFEKKEK